MCGVVSYAANIKESFSACHCGMCMRWAGGPFMGLSVESVEWQGEDNITVFQSSPWAERGFCGACGSNLFYRVTAPGKHHGVISLAFGTLDDTEGLTMDREWFIDRKPASYTFEGERTTLTEAEVMAEFGGA